MPGTWPTGDAYKQPWRRRWEAMGEGWDWKGISLLSLFDSIKQPALRLLACLPQEFSITENSHHDDSEAEAEPFLVKDLLGRE